MDSNIFVAIVGGILLTAFAVFVAFTPSMGRAKKADPAPPTKPTKQSSPYLKPRPQARTSRPQSGDSWSGGHASHDCSGDGGGD